jgi:hypothetical protein
MTQHETAPPDVLADPHVAEGDVTGDELGGGLGNTEHGGANDG